MACDGSVTTNRSGYGGIIRNHMGMAIIAYAGTIPSKNVLWIELYSLYRGLALVVEQGNQHIEISMDSKLAVEILQANYNIPWLALALVGKVKKALEKLQSFSIQHVWREANQAADLLAAYALGSNELLIRNNANQCIDICV